ncbi:MAG: hypothetical protein U1E64_01540 [Sphingomonadaceae bacterium]
MSKIKRQVHLEPHLNAKQSAQLFAKIVHELVQLGEIGLAQVPAATAEFKWERSTEANYGKRA